jgi:hypothetical protein
MDKWFTHDDPVQFLFLNDLLLAPVFLANPICSLPENMYGKKQNPVYKKYFITALAVRMAVCYNYGINLSVLL